MMELGTYEQSTYDANKIPDHVIEYCQFRMRSIDGLGEVKKLGYFCNNHKEYCYLEASIDTSSIMKRYFMVVWDNSMLDYVMFSSNCIDIDKSYDAFGVMKRCEAIV